MSPPDRRGQVWESQTGFIFVVLGTAVRRCRPGRSASATHRVLVLSQLHFSNIPVTPPPGACVVMPEYEHYPWEGSLSRLA